MLKYSIKDLEHLSGIKAHTIRIWEKRYKLLEPNRTNTNIRYYEDEMLKKILNVSILINSGFKISKISQMSADTLVESINTLVNKPIENTNVENHICDLISICISLDSEGLDKKVSELIDQSDLEYTFEHVFVPLLQRVGHLWSTSMLSPGQEHFLSNKIREVLFTAIANTKVVNDVIFLLFLPQWEEHEITLLFCNYLLRKNGYKTIYLGAKVPLESLDETISILKPHNIITHLTTPNQIDLFKKYLNTIPETYKITISGNEEYQPSALEKSNISWIKNIEEFKNVTFV